MKHSGIVTLKADDMNEDCIKLSVCVCVFLSNMDTNHRSIPADKHETIVCPATKEECRKPGVTHRSHTTCPTRDQFKNLICTGKHIWME